MNCLSLNIRGIGGAEKQGWFRNIRMVHGINFIAIQESKATDVAQRELSKFWGNGEFGFESVDSDGLSDGIISMWDSKVIKVSGSLGARNFLYIRGFIKGQDKPVNVINVYAPQGVAAKKSLWNTLTSMINSNDGLWVVVGDFNAVRFKEERRNTNFLMFGLKRVFGLCLDICRTTVRLFLLLYQTTLVPDLSGSLTPGSTEMVLRKLWLMLALVFLVEVRLTWFCLTNSGCLGPELENGGMRLSRSKGKIFVG
ncbi:putative AP endonuclease 1, Endonuclease/exonuclease/phosphatase superfamily [Helianthus debilis subsp. tardiflorus]